MILAIDGPAGTGKSTVAKKAADRLGITYLDTGAMYRAVTLYFLENNIDIGKDVEEALNKIEIRFDKEKTLLQGEDVTEQIRSNEVNQKVSAVSAIPQVRAKMSAIQRAIGKSSSLVAEGRDMGTVVFPNADCKIFLSASADVRAKRRYEEEVQKGKNPNYEQIKASILQRDEMDSNRAIAPLKKAEDALEIDTSLMGIDEVVDAIMKSIEDKHAV